MTELAGLFLLVALLAYWLGWSRGYKRGRQPVKLDLRIEDPHGCVYMLKGDACGPGIERPL